MHMKSVKKIKHGQLSPVERIDKSKPSLQEMRNPAFKEPPLLLSQRNRQESSVPRKLNRNASPVDIDRYALMATEMNPAKNYFPPLKVMTESMTLNPRK